MMSRSSTAAVRSMLGHAARGGAAADVRALFHGGIIPNSKGLKSEIVTRMWLWPVAGSRNASTVALGDKPQEKGGGSGGKAAGRTGGGGNDKKGIVETPKVTKEESEPSEKYKEKYKGPIDRKKYKEMYKGPIDRKKHQVYRVCLGEHAGEKTSEDPEFPGLLSGAKTRKEIKELHHLYLRRVKGSEDEAKACFIQSFKIINGFCAVLTRKEANTLSEMEGVLWVVESQEYELDELTGMSC